MRLAPNGCRATLTRFATFEPQECLMIAARPGDAAQ
jgi:hypothetical protein